MTKLRTIDKGTVYDVPGKLMKLARDIRSGKYGKVYECVVAIRERDEDGERSTSGFWFGTGTQADAVYMLERVKREFLG